MASREQSGSNLPFQKLSFVWTSARQKRDLILSAPEAGGWFSLSRPGHVLRSGNRFRCRRPAQSRPSRTGQSLFDLDCWNKDRPIFAGCANGSKVWPRPDGSRIADDLMELDMEMVLLLRGYVKIHRLDDPCSPDPPSNHYVQFDEHYLIEFIRHDEIFFPDKRLPRGSIRARLQLLPRSSKSTGVKGSKNRHINSAVRASPIVASGLLRSPGCLRLPESE